MDFEIHLKIRKGNAKILQALQNEFLKKAWFICYQLEQCSCRGSPLLIEAWKISIEYIANSQAPPKEDFKEILYSNILELHINGVKQDSDFESIPPPQVSVQYRPFVAEIELLSDELRPIYLLSTYGHLSKNSIAQIYGVSSEEVTKLLKRASEDISRQGGTSNKDEWAKMIRLSTEFRNPSGRGFTDIVIPNYLVTSLAHEVNSIFNKPVPQVRKEQRIMATKTNTNGAAKAVARKNAKKTKITVIVAVVVVVVILGAIFIPKLLANNTMKSASITTYNVEAISTGSVDTTINGSGTLTPISQETLVTTKAGTVTAVNYEVGAKVEKDAVIATLKDDNGNTTEFTAPYDCILIELPISKNDELAANSQVAMVMGTDGFTMGIAVDEQDISTVKVGQEVAFTVSAVDGDYTGKVTAVSYNGSSSNGTTAYQITAKMDYVEGIYPGMSVSAKIVIESSGEGLLVPADAVYTSGDDNYIYLAPSDATEGKEYAEDELDISKLTKVTVKTGMSDGSYIIVESDDIKDGDLIVITKLTATQTGSDNEGQGGFGGMGGFSGGAGGMDFGDFDFENFDPNNMPQGGGFHGMGGN